jgi:hypothetical protein
MVAIVRSKDCVCTGSARRAGCCTASWGEQSVCLVNRTCTIRTTHACISHSHTALCMQHDQHQVHIQVLFQFSHRLVHAPRRRAHMQVLFQFSQAPAAGNTHPHVITEQWFSLFGSARAPYDPNTDARIRVYVDNEVNASLDFQLYFAHTIGVQNCVNDTCSDTRVPWARCVWCECRAHAVVQRFAQQPHLFRGVFQPMCSVRCGWVDGVEHTLPWLL